MINFRRLKMGIYIKHFYRTKNMALSVIYISPKQLFKVTRKNQTMRTGDKLINILK